MVLLDLQTQISFEFEKDFMSDSFSQAVNRNFYSHTAEVASKNLLQGLVQNSDVKKVTKCAINI